MLQPLLRRTWAPVGATPVHVASARHDRVSAIAALTVSPVRSRVRMDFHLLADNFHGADIASSVRKVCGAVRRKLYVVWDRLQGHRTAERLLADLGDKVIIEYPSGYVSELNPIEQVWAHSKYNDLANEVYEDAADLLDHVFDSLVHKQGETELSGNFFCHAGSPL